MSSFHRQDELEIPRATKIVELKQNCDNNNNIGEKSGRETWRCAFAPDESCFAWSCGNRHVVLVPWNKYKNTPLHLDSTDDHGNPVQNNRQLVTIDCSYLVWSLTLGKVTLEGNSVLHCLHGNELVLVTGHTNGRIRLWNINTGRLLNELMDHLDVIREVAFAPDGSMRIVSANFETLKVWDLKDDGNMCKTLYANKLVFSCSWSPTAKYLACVGKGKMVLVWDMTNYKLYRKLEGHLNDVVSSCSFSPDGALLATASWDTNVLLWDPHTAEIMMRFGHLFPPPRPIFANGANDHYVRAVSFSPDGRHVVSVADDGYVRFWDTWDPDSSDPVEVGLTDQPISCAYSSSGKVIAVGSRSGSVSFWAAPSQVGSLQHLCRISIRKLTSTTDLTELQVPYRLREYLSYL